MEVEFVLIDWVANRIRALGGSSQNSGMTGVHSVFELRMPSSLAKLSSQDSSTKIGFLPYSAAPELLIPDSCRRLNPGGVLMNQ
jgi:hypothetical protein